MEGILSTTDVSDNLMRISLNVRLLNTGYFSIFGQSLHVVNVASV